MWAPSEGRPLFFHLHNQRAAAQPATPKPPSRLSIMARRNHLHPLRLAMLSPPCNRHQPKQPRKPHPYSEHPSHAQQCHPKRSRLIRKINKRRNDRTEHQHQRCQQHTHTCNNPPLEPVRHRRILHQLTPFSCCLLPNTLRRYRSTKTGRGEGSGRRRAKWTGMLQWLQAIAHNPELSGQ